MLCENHGLKAVDEHLEHPKVSNKPCPLGHGKTKETF